MIYMYIYIHIFTWKAYESTPCMRFAFGDVLGDNAEFYAKSLVHEICKGIQ